LQNADIRAVISEISRETGKNFLVDPRVSGNVSIISSTPLSAKEVYQVFLSILQVYGFAAIPSGNVIKIVPAANARTLATPVVNGLSPGAGDELVARVLKMKFVPADQLVPILRPLISQWGTISGYQPANSLIILGSANNVWRISRIAQSLDTPDNNGITIVPLKRASATNITNILAKLQSAQGFSNAVKVSISADTRTNSIVLGGPHAARLRLRMLIAELDAKPAETSYNTQVIYLRYQKAKSLAPILSNIVKGSLASAEAEQTEGDKTATTTKAPASIASIGDDSGGTGLPDISIQGEPNTNAIIITAPPALMLTLKSVIKHLDIRPAQVLVEAVIAEVDDGTLEQLGVKWGTEQVGEIGNDNTGSNIPPFATMGGIGVGIITHGSIASVISFLGADNTSDILSTPSVVVMNNQKAKIFVGKDVPFQTGSYAAPGTTGNTSSGVQAFNTIDRERVGLALNVIPQINRGQSVTLNIQQSNSTLGAPIEINSDPVTDSASIQTTVLVNSGDILVLGGLTSNDVEQRITKVPILGDIPILGYLFRHKSSTVEKKNLMVFIRPIILRSRQESEGATSVKYDFIRNDQLSRRFDKRATREVRNSPTLSPWPQRGPIPIPFTSGK